MKLNSSEYYMKKKYVSIRLSGRSHRNAHIAIEIEEKTEVFCRFDLRQVMNHNLIRHVKKRKIVFRRLRINITAIFLVNIS